MTDLEILECFGSVKRRMNCAAVQVLSPMKIGPKQAIILGHLDKNPDSSLSEIARATATDPAATGKAMETLIKQGWVVKKPHPKDRRQCVINLSATGKRRLPQIKTQADHLAAMMISPLSQSERAQFLKILKKISKALQLREE